MAKHLRSSVSSASGVDVDYFTDEAEELAAITEERELSIPLGFFQPELFRLIIIQLQDIEPQGLNSPFDHLFETEQKKRKNLIEEIKHLPHPYAKRLYRRIQLLAEDAEEEYPEEELLSTESLEGFLKFMNCQEGFKYPDATISPNGNIRIQWQQDKEHHLAIEFVSDTEAKIVVFASVPGYPGKVARASARLLIDRIIDVIAPFGALDWVTE